MFYFYFPAKRVSVCESERVPDWILHPAGCSHTNAHTHTRTVALCIYPAFTYDGDSFAAVSVFAVFDFQLVQRGV